MNRPSLYSVNVWEQWERGILNILLEALPQLCDYVEQDYVEDDITTELYKLIMDITFHNRQITFGTIIPQAQNQPINPLGKQENKTRLRKRPDLQWIFNDENASTPEKSRRCFTIECKCLSKSGEEKKYVEKGISRFVLDEWGYGKNEKSAIMIGYMKDESVDKRLCKVNEYNDKCEYPLLIICHSENKAVCRYIQKFETREFEPKCFRLHHLWVNVSN